MNKLSGTLRNQAIPDLNLGKENYINGVPVFVFGTTQKVPWLLRLYMSKMNEITGISGLSLKQKKLEPKKSLCLQNEILKLGSVRMASSLKATF